MSRIFILYGSTDGQTAKIAEFIADTLRVHSASADVVEAGKQPADPRDYDGTIVAASVHVGGYQRAVERWAREHVSALRAKPSAFISVCLGILQKDEKVHRDLETIKDRFVAHTGWQPPQVKIVAGAVRYTRYGWLKRVVMRYMAGKAGGSTDISRDHEYTDWVDLASWTAGFLAAIPARSVERIPAGVGRAP